MAMETGPCHLSVKGIKFSKKVASLCVVYVMDSYAIKLKSRIIKLLDILKQKPDYLFIITESKLPKFEFWRTFSLVSEASFVY